MVLAWCRQVLSRCWQVLSRCWQVLARCSECDGKVLAVCHQCTCRLKTPLRRYISQSSHVQTFIKTSYLTHTNSCQHLASILPAPCQHLASTLPAAYRQQPVPRCRQNASRLQTATSTLQPAHIASSVQTTASTSLPSKCQPFTDRCQGP